MSSTQLAKKEASKKGWMAVGAGIATTASFFLWWPIGIVGILGTGFLTYNWFKYRGENGLRF